MNIFLNSFTYVLETGFQRALQLSDLPELPDDLQSTKAQARMSAASAQVYLQDVETAGRRLRHRNKPVWCCCRIALRAYGAEFLYLGILKLLTCILSFVGPVLLNRIVHLVENNPDSSDLLRGLGMAAVLFSGLAALSVVGAQYSIRAALLQIKIRGALTRAIFSRSMALPEHVLQSAGITEGEIANMVQIDVTKIADVVGSLHDLWNLPLLLVIAFTLLYFQVKIGFLAGVAVIIVMLPINSLIAKKIGEATAELMKQKDARVSYVSDAIRGMKSVKMLGLESIIMASSMVMRDKEVHHLSVRKYLDAVCVFLWASLPILVPFCTFLTTIYIGEELTASEVFTTIALLNMLIFPMNAFPWVINGIVEGSVSGQRVMKLLFIEDRNSGEYKSYRPTGLPGFESVGRVYFGCASVQDVSPVIEPTSTAPKPTMSLTDHGNFVYSSMHFIFLNNVFASWCRRAPGSTASAFLLGPLSMTLPAPETALATEEDEDGSGRAHRDYLVCVCGAVGSGKSMFLKSLLQETLVTRGEIKFVAIPGIAQGSWNFRQFSDCLRHEIDNNFSTREDISFCAQIPGMYSGSIWRNITIGLRPVGADMALQRRYDIIFDGCCLSKDFYNSETTLSVDRESRLSDLSEVGQNGNRLSGGQRLRVVLARALYGSAPVIVLDDPFSALDDSTAREILAFLKKFAAAEQRIVIFSTHKLHLIPEYVDRIIFLDSGRCMAMGSYSELMDVESYRELLNTTDRRPQNETTFGNAVVQVPDGGTVSDDTMDGVKADQGSLHDFEGEKEQLDLEISNVGRIKSSVYSAYLGAAGSFQVFVIVSSTFLMQVTAILMQYWLAYWVAHSDSISDNKFMLLFGIICIVNVVCAIVRSFSFAKAGLDSCRKIYSDLTKSVLCAPLHFFEVTSLGRIVNRFGKETERIDDNLPFVANIVLAQFFSFAGAIVIISISNFLMIPVIVLSMVRYYYLQRFYRASSREVRRLESTYRSPMYTLISDCIGDSVSIRACKQLFDNLEISVSNALDESLRVSLVSCICAQWLNIRLQLLGALITALVGLLAIVCSIYGIIDISPGLFGLALALSFTLVRNLNGLVTAVTETEQEMISVERVFEYCCIPSEFSTAEVELIAGHDVTRQRYLCCMSKQKEVWTSKNSRNLSRNSFTESFLSGVDSIMGTTELVDRLSVALNGERYGFDESNTPLLHQEVVKSTLDITKIRKDFFDGNIHFSSFYMSYESTRITRYALSDINVTIPAGSRVALLGQTGSGKTSMLRALLGLNKYTGSLQFGGKELRDIPLSVLRGGCIGVIPQDPFLFTGSIRYNLDPFDEFEEFELIEALSKSNIVKTFSSGKVFSSVVTPKDVTDPEAGIPDDIEIISQVLNYDVGHLSTGQRQLVCLARCVLRKTMLVLVDEATSSLDPQAEANLFKALLASIPFAASVVIICHNPDLITPFCNIIIELNKGIVKKFERKDVIL